jgi:uncharacterized protein YycO
MFLVGNNASGCYTSGYGEMGFVVDHAAMVFQCGQDMEVWRHGLHLSSNQMRWI